MAEHTKGEKQVAYGCGLLVMGLMLFLGFHSCGQSETMPNGKTVEQIQTETRTDIAKAEANPVF